MVHNKNNILDDGTNKFLPDVIEMVPQYVTDFKVLVHNANSAVTRLSAFSERHFKRNGYGGQDVFDENGKKIITEGEDYHRIMNSYQTLLKEVSEIKDMDFLEDYQFVSITKSDYPKIARFMGHIPFTPSVMFNISPNWKGKEGMDIKKAHLKSTLEVYLNSCNRYDYWKAVIECGGDGDFVHAHVVAHVNPACAKSVKTHINKGNHCRDMIKIFKKRKLVVKTQPADAVEGKRGPLEGKYAIQRIWLNNETLVSDKLDYLIEEKKPEGHKNLELKGFPCLFTSK